MPQNRRSVTWLFAWAAIRHFIDGFKLPEDVSVNNEEELLAALRKRRMA
jgi:hypothetical protein